MFEQIKERQRFSRSKCVLTYPSLSDRRGRRSLQGVCAALLFLSNINFSVYCINKIKTSVFNRGLLRCDGYVRTYYFTCRIKSQRLGVQPRSGMRGSMSRPLYCDDLLPPPAGGADLKGCRASADYICPPSISVAFLPRRIIVLSSGTYSSGKWTITSSFSRLFWSVRMSTVAAAVCSFIARQAA